MAASTMLSPAGGILDKKVGSKNGKSAGSKRPAQPLIKCPECGSLRIWKDGLRYTNLGSVQRYICRNCAYRFSDPHFQHAFNDSDLSQHVQRVQTKKIKRHTIIPSPRQVCAALTRGTKNLTEVETRQEKAQREGTKPDLETVKGLLAQYAYWLEKEGYYENSTYPRLLQVLVKRGANLLDPESVKTVIARQHWKNGTKMLAVYAYDIMAKNILKIEWAPPKYSQEEILPFITEETELNQLIAAASQTSRRLAAYLQTLKETFADPGEALRLRWIDVDFSNSTITINQPVKGHRPRRLKISSKLVAILNTLPKTSERIFPRRANRRRVMHNAGCESG